MKMIVIEDETSVYSRVADFLDVRQAAISRP
jgi:hypothetical protein